MSKSLSGLAASAALAVVLGLGSASLQAADVAADFKLLPADSNLVAVIQMEKLLASDAFAKLRKAIPEIDKEGKGFDVEFRREFGFDIKALERMTIGGRVQDQPVMVLRLKTPVKAADVAKVRAEDPRNKDVQFKEEKVGTHTLYVPSAEYRDAFCQLDDKTLLYGRAKTLKPLLEDAKNSGLGPVLQPVIKAADLKADVVLLMDLKDVTSKEKLDLPGLDVKKVIDSTTGAYLTVKVGPEVTVRGVALCKDAAAAEQVKKTADAGLGFFALAIKQGGDKVPKELVDLPGKVKTSTNGSNAEATVTVKDDVAVAFIKSMMLGGSAPQPPPPAKPVPDKK